MLCNVYKKISVFFSDENGAVTVDFVVLTAGAVLIGLTVAAFMTTEVNNATNSIDLSVTQP